MINIKTIKRLRVLRANLESQFDTNGFSHSERAKFTFNNTQFTWKRFDYDGMPTTFSDMESGDTSTVCRYITYLHRNIRAIRQEMKTVPDNSAIGKAVEHTRIWLESVLSKAFPSKNFTVECDRHSSFSLQQPSMHQPIEVGVSMLWTKKVYSLGISTVEAGDGKRVILDAKERKLTRLTRDGIRAFECRALKVYKGKADLDTSWVFLYDCEEPVTAIHQNFGRAESLIKRRIKDTVTKELMDF